MGIFGSSVDFRISWTGVWVIVNLRFLLGELMLVLFIMFVVKVIKFFFGNCIFRFIIWG